MNNFYSVQLMFSLLILVSDAAMCRDPFSALPSTPEHQVKKVVHAPPPAQRSPGLSGLRIVETSLVGIVSSEDLSLAILAGEDHVTYIVSVGSRLWDGKVLQISEYGVLFSRSDNSTALFIPFLSEIER